MKREDTGEDIAVFWDFGILPQVPRNDDEETGFRTGVQSCQMLYSHTLSNVWVQSRLPGNFTKATYAQSSWCPLEAGVSSVLKDWILRIDLGQCTLHEDDYAEGILLLPRSSSIVNSAEMCDRPARPDPAQGSSALFLHARGLGPRSAPLPSCTTTSIGPSPCHYR